MDERILYYQDRMWSVQVRPHETDTNKAYVVTIYGKITGKLQVNRRLVTGKNKGKQNETSALEQAILEAASKFALKKKCTSRTPILPMLAQPYAKGKGIEFPCFVQPKLDGIRGIYCPITKCFRSRQGNEFPIANTKHMINDLCGTDVQLDGEFYSKQISFEMLKGVLSKKTKHCDAPLVQFHIFDCIILSESFKSRLEILSNMKFGESISFVQTEECKELSNVEFFLKDFKRAGYEGLILRNSKGLYIPGKRTADLQKYKTFLDKEFKIIGYKRENNSNAIVWECETDKKQSFFAKPVGTIEARAPTEEEANTFIGKFLTVKYQEMTAAGIPRFPVGLTVRDYE
jgi:ATP-dependent DNA ligase